MEEEKKKKSPCVVGVASERTGFCVLAVSSYATAA